MNLKTRISRLEEAAETKNNSQQHSLPRRRIELNATQCGDFPTYVSRLRSSPGQCAATEKASYSSNLERP